MQFVSSPKVKRRIRCRKIAYICTYQITSQFSFAMLPEHKPDFKSEMRTFLFDSFNMDFFESNFFTGGSLSDSPRLSFLESDFLTESSSERFISFPGLFPIPKIASTITSTEWIVYSLQCGPCHVPKFDQCTCTAALGDSDTSPRLESLSMID